MEGEPVALGEMTVPDLMPISYGRPGFPPRCVRLRTSQTGGSAKYLIATPKRQLPDVIGYSSCYVFSRPGNKVGRSPADGRQFNVV